MFTSMKNPSWLAIAGLVLSGCDESGLQLDAEGRVAYEWPKPKIIDTNLTDGHFSQEHGCIVFTRYDGRRFLPILPEGQLYSVEPMHALFDDDWAVSGFDENSDAVKSLRDDPVAIKCNATPAFIAGIQPKGPPPPVPPPLSESPEEGLILGRVRKSK
jgi:hypothetical protein